MEIRTCNDLRIYVYHGASRTDDRKQLQNYNVILTTYNLLESAFRKQESALREKEAQSKSGASYNPSSSTEWFLMKPIISRFVLITF